VSYQVAAAQDADRLAGVVEDRDGAKVFDGEQLGGLADLGRRGDGDDVRRHELRGGPLFEDKGRFSNKP
jgi:hypothetical protein